MSDVKKIKNSERVLRSLLSFPKQHTHPNFHFFAPRDISSVVLAQHHRIANDDAHTGTESEMFQKEKYGEILAR